MGDSKSCFKAIKLFSISVCLQPGEDTTTPAHRASEAAQSKGHLHLKLVETPKPKATSTFQAACPSTGRKWVVSTDF